MEVMILRMQFQVGQLQIWIHFFVTFIEVQLGVVVIIPPDTDGQMALPIGAHLVDPKQIDKLTD